jgi:hypothetical protein
MALWNTGTEVIESNNDFAAANPLRITANPGTVLLHTSVIGLTNKDMGLDAQVNSDGSAVDVSFDYMDANQGAAIQVIYWGKGKRGISVAGTLKGGRLRQSRYDLSKEQLQRQGRAIPSRWAGLFIMSLLAVGGMGVVLLLRDSATALSNARYDLVAVGVLGTALIAGLVWWATMRVAAQALMPRELEVIYERLPPSLRT